MRAITCRRASAVLGFKIQGAWTIDNRGRSERWSLIFPSNFSFRERLSRCRPSAPNPGLSGKSVSEWQAVLFFPRAIGPRRAESP